jgi:hypothetical protein
MNTPPLIDIAPYLRQPRRFDPRRLEAIGSFLRDELKFVHVQGRYNWNFGSCTTFGVAVDCRGAETDVGNDEAHLVLTIYVSERAPLVTSRGLELRPTLSAVAIAPRNGLGYEITEMAETRAQGLAQAVAQRFDLEYVEREWLRQFGLEASQLTEDGMLSLDSADPNALNVLFTEEL